MMERLLLGLILLLLLLLVGAAATEHNESNQAEKVWRKAGTKYQSLHTKMIRRVESGDISNARLLVFRICCGELGNRMMALISSYVLAMVTNRALIIDWPEVPDFTGDSYLQLFEPPFNSTWDFARISALVRSSDPSLHTNMLNTLRSMSPGCSQGSEAVCFIDLTNREPGPFGVLMCEDPNALLGHVPIVIVQSNQYFISVMAENPIIRPLLLKLFPDMDDKKHAEIVDGTRAYMQGLFGRVARIIAQPRSSILQAVRRFKDKHFHGYVIGMQIRRQRRKGRDKEGAGTSKAHEATYFQCAQALLAEHNTQQSHTPAAHPSAMKLPVNEGRANYTVFVATDFEGSRRAAVKVFGPQTVFLDEPLGTDARGMELALMDILLLGECDDLITTSGSTFGYFAHSRVSKIPAVVTLATPPQCIRIASSEPCLHTWPFLLSLPCVQATSQQARQVWGHAHCHPWDMEWFSDAGTSGFSTAGVTHGAKVINLIRQT